MTDTRQRTTLGTHFRFLTRAVGLTGLLVCSVGLGLWYADAPPLSDLPHAWDHLRATGTAVFDGEASPYTTATVYLILGGLAAVALAVFVELIGGLATVTGRRTAANTSATVATVAAVALLFFVNAYSFEHHARYDFTRERQFTLPPELADRLRKLSPEAPTTIVVLQMHRTFGSLTDKRDSYTKAAEEKVTEKVKDLVDLFREFGPRFNVAVLDTEAFGYDRQLAELTKDAPELRAAIEAAPENSIFFHANKRVQRLAFNEFLQLDKTASREANDGRGNLVLLPQGVENFARRVLTAQERRPKVAVCVVHEWLSTAATTGQTQYSLGGLKRTLTDHGFDVVDIILRKNWETKPDPDPAAYTINESKLERLEAEFDSARSQHRAAQNDVKIIASIRQAFDELPKEPFRDRGGFYPEFNQVAVIRGWQEIVKAFRQWADGETEKFVTEANEPALRAALAAGLTRQAARAEREVKEAEKVRAEAEEQVKAAYQDERSVESRRMAEVKAKFTALLSDVDLLIIPRYTLVNATIGPVVSDGFHNLSKPQVEVIKDFMKAGKPVLACLGSLSAPGGFDEASSDDLEKLIADRGIELGRDTVLYDIEAKAYAALKSGRQLGGSASDIPPLVFVPLPEAVEAKPNPVGAAVRLTGRSVDQKLDLQLRAPRPVYLAKGWQKRLPYSAEFVFTGPDSWNEEQPFLRRDRATGRIGSVPRYEPTLDDDPKWGTHLAEKKGPFPVGVAIESKVPASWFDEAYTSQQAAAALLTPMDGVMSASLTATASKLDRPTQRLVVFGSGNLFAGAKLEPPQEKLLLHSVNWLTDRTDRLPQAEHPPWSFPRVQMSARDATLWRLGMSVGLPLLAVYLGLMVMMVRRLR